MQKYLLIFKSLTYAQRASRQLFDKGIYSSLEKAPKSVSAKGCAYGIIVSENKFQDAKKILSNISFIPQKICKIKDDGSIVEVES